MRSMNRSRSIIHKFRLAILSRAALCILTCPVHAQKPELVVQAGHSEMLTSLEYSPNGQLLVSTSFDGLAILWDTKNKIELKKWNIGGTVHCASFSPDGNMIAIGSSFGVIIVDINTGKLVQNWRTLG